MNAVMFFQSDSPHPAHRVFGDAIGCDYVHFEKGQRQKAGDNGYLRDRLLVGYKYKDYDLIIAEGSAPLQTALVSGFFNENNKVIFLAADRTFQTLSGRRSKWLWKAAKVKVRRLVDGTITVSRTTESWFRPYIDTETRVVRPPIMNDKRERLLDLDIDVSGRMILSVGRPSDSKNHAVLVDVVDETDTHAVVLGQGHENRSYASHPHIHTPGFVSIEELVDYFRRASLYLQPSKGDAFPVAALEAMVSGTPTIVTENVGTSEILKEEMITRERRIVEDVSSFLDRPEVERKDIAMRQRDRASKFTEDRQAEMFKKAVLEMIE